MRKPAILISTASLIFAVLLAISACSLAEAKAKPQTNGDYVCIPCGRDCDKQSYKQEGQCPHCNMKLVKQSTIVFDTISPAEICNYLAANPGVILLDVRTDNEFNGKAEPHFGRLKNAINIPIQQLDERLAELEQHKGKQIIVYCSHSKRSPQASWILTQNGFTNVTNMAGGMRELESVSNKNCLELK